MDFDYATPHSHLLLRPANMKEGKLNPNRFLSFTLASCGSFSVSKGLFSAKTHILRKTLTLTRTSTSSIVLETLTTMSVKRNWTARSPSIGEICVLDQAKPIDSPTVTSEKRKALQHTAKPSFMKPDQSIRGLLKLGSPLRDTSNERTEIRFDEQIGGFLKACYYCKKKIGEKDDIFMYSYLCAFCTPKCRDKQIALDAEVEATYKKSNATKSERNHNNTNGQIGAQPRNVATSKFHI